MIILFWGRWRGAEQLLWHPRGGHVEPEEVMPPALASGISGARRGTWVESRGGREHVWTVLPVKGGVFLASGRVPEHVLRELARAEFRLLPGIDSMLEEAGG